MASSFEAKNLIATLPEETRADTLADAEQALRELAQVFLKQSLSPPPASHPAESRGGPASSEAPLANMEAKYRALLEQIPAVIFMAYLDQGIGEAYVSPQIEEALGFSQSEWLEDPVRWYQRIHPDDKTRWSVEAADMFLSGKPLRSAYRPRPGDRPRRARSLVPLRSQDDSPRGRQPLVYSRRRRRHHGLEGGGRCVAPRTQRPLRHSRYGGRARRGPRPCGQDRALQSGLRAVDRLLF